MAMLSVKEASEKVGLYQMKVRRAIYSGELKAKLMGVKQIRIEEEDLMNWYNGLFKDYPVTQKKEK